MRIIGHIHAFNDENIIDEAIDALLSQTYPVNEIILIDNASSDGTASKTFPKGVTLIRHPKNLGTSGAVATGFKYALSKGYDWMWVLDADSIPHKDALERLIELYNGLGPAFQDQIGVLNSLCILDPDRELSYVIRLTPTGQKLVRIDPDKTYTECDATIWSGSLYKLKILENVGLPRFGTAGCWEDLCLDMGDIEFGSRISQAGYKLLVHRSSLIEHRIGKIRQVSLLGRKLFTSNHSPFRRYLSFRNQTYFWLYLYPNRHVLSVIFFLLSTLIKTHILILLTEDNRTQKMLACVLGMWDGLFKKLHGRY